MFILFFLNVGLIIANNSMIKKILYKQLFEHTSVSLEKISKSWITEP